MTADKIKRQIITILQEFRPDPSISVVDAQNFEGIEMPVLAVGIPTMEPHNVALVGIHRIGVEITLRAQSGDDQTREELEAWCDEIESLLNDPTTMKSSIGNGVRLDHWEYEGCEPEWKDVTLECVFSANGLVQRTR